MKCAMCNHDTDWNDSYGRKSFIVCPTCHKKITKAIGELRDTNLMNDVVATHLILLIGFTKEGIDKYFLS